MTRAYFGKYRGKVVKPGEQDAPPSPGMLKVVVPDVLGEASRWAMPCVPYAGPRLGWFVLPPVGANVWVEFEAGNPTYPVWSGGYWAAGEAPANPAVPELKVVKLDAFTLTVDSRTANQPIASLQLEVGTAQQPRTLRLIMNSDGIELNAEQKTAVKLTANEVQVTNGSAKVTLTSNQIVVQAGGNPATITVTDDSINMKAASALETLSKNGVELANGTPRIAIDKSSVSVNNGNLEVLV